MGVKRTLIYLATAFLCLLPLGAYAHSYKTDGDISVLLHAEPGDAPVARKEGSLYFFITDRTNRLQPSKCNCRVVVKEGGRTILDRPLFDDLSDQPSGINAQIPIKFPKKDVYDITVTASPKAAGSFQPVKFDFSQRVDRQASGFSLSGVTVAYAALAVAGAILLQRIIIALLRRQTAKVKV